MHQMIVIPKYSNLLHTWCVRSVKCIGDSLLLYQKQLIDSSSYMRCTWTYPVIRWHWVWSAILEISVGMIINMILCTHKHHLFQTIPNISLELQRNVFGNQLKSTLFFRGSDYRNGDENLKHFKNSIPFMLAETQCVMLNRTFHRISRKVQTNFSVVSFHFSISLPFAHSFECILK